MDDFQETGRRMFKWDKMNGVPRKIGRQSATSFKVYNKICEIIFEGNGGDYLSPTYFCP